LRVEQVGHRQSRAQQGALRCVEVDQRVRRAIVQLCGQARQQARPD
jgi:hypothetical protein